MEIASNYGNYQGKYEDFWHLIKIYTNRIIPPAYPDNYGKIFKF